MLLNIVDQVYVSGVLDLQNEEENDSWGVIVGGTMTYVHTKVLKIAYHFGAVVLEHAGLDILSNKIVVSVTHLVHSNFVVVELH